MSETTNLGTGRDVKVVESSRAGGPRRDGSLLMRGRLFVLLLQVLLIGLVVRCRRFNLAFRAALSDRPSSG